MEALTGQLRAPGQSLIQLLGQGVHRPVLTPLLEFSQQALRLVIQPGQCGSRPDAAVLLYAEEPHEAVFRNGAGIAQLRRRGGEGRLVLPGLDQLLVVPVEGVRGVVIAAGQRLQEDPVPLRLAGGPLQPFVHLVFADPHPVQGVRQHAGDLAHLGRLVGGLNQSLNGQAVAEGAADAGGHPGPLCHILLVLDQLAQQLAGLRGRVRVSQDLIKLIVGGGRGLRAVSRRLIGGIQFALGDPVLLRGAVHGQKRRRYGAGGGGAPLDKALGGAA